MRWQELKRLVILATAGVWLVAASPCDPTCPEGANLSPEQTCVYHISSQGRTIRINQGELTIQIPSGALRRAQHAEYTFWFIEQPEKNAASFIHPFGQWELMLRNQNGPHPDRLSLSWRLRNRPRFSNAGASVRLAVRLVGANRTIRYHILPGHYDPQTGIATARLDRKLLKLAGVSVVPVHYLPQVVAHK